MEVGNIVEGKVTGLTKFGAFVSLPGGKSGLVHISEVANKYVSDISEFLAIGQQVNVKVISITDDGKINLSIKQAQAQQERPAQRPQMRQSVRTQAAPKQAGSYEGYVPQRSDDEDFEDKLKSFLQESGSKMSGSRLYENQKRGQRRKRK